MKGPKLSDTNTVTICEDMPGARHGLHILQIANHLDEAWCGRAGSESQVCLTAKLTVSPVTPPPPLRRPRLPSSQRLAAHLLQRGA